MKKILIVLAVVGMFSFQACEGPPGPPGTPGQDGLLGVVYENSNNNYYNFTVANNFIVRFNFPNLIYDSDVVLVYRLGGVVNGKAIWEFLPETYYFENGTRDFSYNFNFTNSYVDIYLNGNDLVTVPTENRLNQIFRIVVVPADFASTVNKNDINNVISALNINENQIQKINF